MTHKHDPLERELAALEPAEPSAELAKRIGARLAAEATTSPVTKTDGTRSVPTAYWLALAGAMAAGLLVAVALWRGSDVTQQAELPLDLPHPTLATALDETLPTVWTFRPALESSDSLNQLLDKHAPRPSAGGDNVQTRGFGPVTMNLNSRLGGL